MEETVSKSTSLYTAVHTMNEKTEGISYKDDTPSNINVSGAYADEKDIHLHLQQKDEDLAQTRVGDHGTHRVLVSPPTTSVLVMLTTKAAENRVYDSRCR